MIRVEIKYFDLAGNRCEEGFTASSQEEVNRYLEKLKKKGYQVTGVKVL